NKSAVVDGEGAGVIDAATGVGCLIVLEEAFTNGKSCAKREGTIVVDSAAVLATIPAEGAVGDVDGGSGVDIDAATVGGVGSVFGDGAVDEVETGDYVNAAPILQSWGVDSISGNRAVGH